MCVLGASASLAQIPDVDSTIAPIDTLTPVEPDTLIAPPPAAQPVTSPPPAMGASTPRRSLRDRVYFGGSIIVTFGDVTRIGVYPMIAYKFTPKLSLGFEAGYEYLKYDNVDQHANNYGGSIFGRYRIIPKLYAHAEYQMVNYEIITGPNTSERDWIPYLLLGGGLSTKMGPNTWSYVEVLFDVLQDDKSPYESGEPFISVGVGVGF
jgi:hypothetical protein